MKKLRLSQGRSALMDDEDYPRVSGYAWWACQNPRSCAVRGWVDGREIYLHRFILDAPRNMQVDHINGDALDNRRCNIRICTVRENHCNVRKTVRDTTSRHKGVCRYLKGTWQAGIKVNGKRINLGHFDDEIDAARAYDRAALIHFGEFARINGA